MCPGKAHSHSWQLLQQAAAVVVVVEVIVVVVVVVVIVVVLLLEVVVVVVVVHHGYPQTSTFCNRFPLFSSSSSCIGTTCPLDDPINDCPAFPGVADAIPGTQCCNKCSGE